MEPAETAEGDHLPCFRRLHRSPGRSVSTERHVWPVSIIEAGLLASAAQKMTFTEHDEVVGELPPKRPDNPLGVAVLPRRLRRDAKLQDAEVHPAVEGGTEDFVTIASQEPER